MRWQKYLRFAIAIFVVVFVAIVAVALRRGKQGTPVDVAAPKRTQPEAVLENTAGGSHVRKEGDKVVFAIKFGSQFIYADGRQKLGGGVEVQTQRGGRAFKITSKEAELIPADQGIKTGHFRGDVTLTTEDGLLVKTAAASYDDAAAMVTVPGAVRFSKGRMTGSGVGATYDRNRDVLWILDRAQTRVTADPRGGGAIDAAATSAGIARTDHYMVLNGGARITSKGRTVRGTEITIHFTEDGERMQTMLIRGSSRIDGGGNGPQSVSANDIDVTYTEDGERVQTMLLRGGSRIDGGGRGPQSMLANDIDLTYGEDGKALQFAKLMQNAVLQLPGTDRGQGKRVAGSAIDLALAPDGATVTNLTATGQVQLDLPPEAGTPGRRIKSDSLVAGGTAAGGLQEATFTGNVDFRETRTARGNVAALNRTARSMRLVVKTKPGLGAIEQADFRGNVRFTDGGTTADAPHAVYQVALERLDLEPSEDPGPPPMVSDSRMELRARTIELTLSTRSMKADTRVRSTVVARKGGAAPADATRMPALLKPDDAVTITSNRMSYDGAAGQAIYSGNAALWQAETMITADTIILDDKTGNLTAKEKVATKMTVHHTDSKTKTRKTVEQLGRGQLFEYTDAKRLAIYTTDALLTGPEGDISGDRIELFLKEKSNELERVEAYGKVKFKEDNHSGIGSRLTYTVADDRYLMTGSPVEITEMTPPDCSIITGATFTYFRATGKTTVIGDGVHPHLSRKIVCAAATGAL